MHFVTCLEPTEYLKDYKSTFADATYFSNYSRSLKKKTSFLICPIYFRWKHPQSFPGYFPAAQCRSVLCGVHCVGAKERTWSFFHISFQMYFTRASVSLTGTVHTVDKLYEPRSTCAEHTGVTVTDTWTDCWKCARAGITWPTCHFSEKILWYDSRIASAIVCSYGKLLSTLAVDTFLIWYSCIYFI